MRIVEINQIPSVYCDGICAAEIIPPGANVRITFFEVRKIEGECVMVPVLEMIRPLSSCGAGVLARMLRQAAGPSVVVLH